MKHYTNKSTNEVYGYKSDADAREYNDDYSNLVLMSDELFEEFKTRPAGGKWTYAGWVIDDELLAEELEAKNEAIKSQQATQKAQLLSAVKEEIEILQDTIDFDEHDDGDEAYLLELKKYRVQLNKVDTSVIDCEFPQKPEK